MFFSVSTPWAWAAPAANNNAIKREERNIAVISIYQFRQHCRHGKTILAPPERDYSDAYPRLYVVLRRGTHQAGVMPNQVGQVIDLQFGKQVCAMRFNRTGRQRQRPTNLLIGQALDNQRQHLALTLGQTGVTLAHPLIGRKPLAA